jgi:hypothetical protein
MGSLILRVAFRLSLRVPAKEAKACRSVVCILTLVLYCLEQSERHSVRHCHAVGAVLQRCHHLQLVSGPLRSDHLTMEPAHRHNAV